MTAELAAEGPAPAVDPVAADPLAVDPVEADREAVSYHGWHFFLPVSSFYTHFSSYSTLLWFLSTYADKLVLILMHNNLFLSHHCYGSTGTGGSNKSGRRRALADSRGKLALNNNKTNKKQARNGGRAARRNDWEDNPFF